MADKKPSSTVEITRLLKKWRDGDRAAFDLLVELVYNELRRIAKGQLSRERKHHTLQPTELVNEVIPRLLDQKVDWVGRRHFYAIVATAMRRLLVDYARRRGAAKRPQPNNAENVDDVPLANTSNLEEMLAIDEALTILKERSERQATIAELRLFLGLELTEIARLLNVSLATVRRDWKEAKALLITMLGSRRR